jgi:hypothetical protein
MFLMPHPYVTRVTFTDDQIVLTVQLDLFPSGEFIEISGFATQNSGGFANFYDIQPVKKNPDGTVIMYVKATPTKAFENGEDVTVSLRAAIVWVTVLTETQDEEIEPTDQSKPATGGATAQAVTALNGVTAVGWASGGPVPSWGAGQASAGSDSSFQGA